MAAPTKISYLALLSCEKTHFWDRKKKKKGKNCFAIFPFLSFYPPKPRHVERSEAERDISLPYNNLHTISIYHHKIHSCLEVCICDLPINDILLCHIKTHENEICRIWRIDFFRPYAKISRRLWKHLQRLIQNTIFAMLIPDSPWHRQTIRCYFL